MLNWIRILLDSKGYEERLCVEGKRQIAHQLSQASWWFGEDPALCELLRDIAHDVAYFGSVDAHQLREKWRDRREKARAQAAGGETADDLRVERPREDGK